MMYKLYEVEFGVVLVLKQRGLAGGGPWFQKDGTNNGVGEVA